MSEILVLSTADSMEVARTIARALVEAEEAACVNIVSGIQSIYRWQGKICDEAEVLLVIKSTRACFDAINSRIHSLHPYEVPEVIAVPVEAGDPAYLKWLYDSIQK
jgi:periplasmic divalent cation tolerance protein